MSVVTRSEELTRDNQLGNHEEGSPSKCSKEFSLAEPRGRKSDRRSAVRIFLLQNHEEPASFLDLKCFAFSFTLI
jgi:hypothetical protein